MPVTIKAYSLPEYILMGVAGAERGALYTTESKEPRKEQEQRSECVFNEFVILSGSGNPKLASDTILELVKLGYKPDIEATRESKIEKFADGESKIELGPNLRRKGVFIIQSTSPPNVDSHFIELFNMIDAAKRAWAEEIIAVVPYFGYARQDRKGRSRQPVSAKVMAETIQERGARSILSFDLHAPQITSFVDIPWDTLPGSKVLSEEIASRGWENYIFASPDRGGFERALEYSELLHTDEPAIAFKRRDPKKKNHSEVIQFQGDVSEKHVIFVDDMIDTAGTIVNASNEAKARKAESVRAAATHGLFSGPALERIANSVLQEVIVTDTVKINDEVSNHPKITVVSVAPLLAEGIHRIYTGDSLSAFYPNS